MSHEGSPKELDSSKKTSQEEKEELKTLLSQLELKITELKRHIVDTQSMLTQSEKDEWKERLFRELENLLEERESILNSIASIDISQHKLFKSIFSREETDTPQES